MAGGVSLALLLAGILVVAAARPEARGSDADDDGPEAPLAPGGGSLVTYGSHQYYVAQVGHPAESALISAPDGTVWVADSTRLVKTTNGGQTWVNGPSFTPPNAVVGVVPEGDIAVAPNGDILTSWLTINDPYSAAIFVSTNGGASFSFKTIEGPQPFPDRPWIMTSAISPANASNPLQPNPYLSISESGFPVKPIFVSGDRGNTWVTPMAATIGPISTPASLPPLSANPYLDYTKPFRQGNVAQYLAMPDGSIYDRSAFRYTYDGVHWFQVTNWPALVLPGQYKWFDVGSDGTIWAVGITTISGQLYVVYKWFDGTAWNDGAAQVPLTAIPSYQAGLLTSSQIMAAVKSHGSTLGINTRQGSQDVLILISNADTAGATWTKDLVGSGSGARYDFPNLVFDEQGRAVTSFKSSWVAYARTP